MMLRKKVAESGVNYNELSGIYKAQKEDAKEILLNKVAGCTEEDVEELVELMTTHFENPDPQPMQKSADVQDRNSNEAPQGGEDENRAPSSRKQQYHNTGYHSRHYNQQNYHHQYNNRGWQRGGGARGGYQSRGGRGGGGYEGGRGYRGGGG